MANTAEIIGKRLYLAGCRLAFGIPGGVVGGFSFDGRLEKLRH